MPEMLYFSIQNAPGECEKKATSVAPRIVNNICDEDQS